jgi:zinc transport system permease protein
MEELRTIIEYGFMQRAFVAALAVAAVAPSLGIFIVARRQSLLADTLSHATLAGAALGIALGTGEALWPPLAAAAFSAIALERLRRGARLPSDAALSLVLTGSLALAVVILSAQGQNGALLNALFGSILTITWPEVWWTVGIAFVIGTCLALYRRSMEVLLLDDDLGKAVGVPVERRALLLALGTALFVAIGMRVTGVLLISALLILPVVAAGQLGYGLALTRGFATIIALTSVVIGLIVSYTAGTAAGATIALVLLAATAFTALIRRAT